MTVTFRKDAKARRYVKYEYTTKTVGQKKAKSSSLDAIFNITALIIAVISCEHNPTARSEKARLRNSFLTVAGIVEFFIKARMTKRFPRVATRENTKFKTQKPRKKLLLWETSVIQKSRNRVHFCSAIVLLFTTCMYLSWLKLIATVITHPFISYFPHRPSAVARNKAGSLTKALDLMLYVECKQKFSVIVGIDF